MDLIENLKNDLKNSPSVIEEGSKQLQAVKKLNLATQSELAKQLAIEKILDEKLINAAANIMYNQNTKIQGLEEKLMSVGEYDPKEVEKFMLRKQKMDTNKQKYNTVLKLLQQELNIHQQHK